MFDFTGLEPIIDKAARAAHQTYPDHHNIADTKSALWVYVFENPTSIENIYRTAYSPEGVVFKYLTGEAYKHLKKEDAATYGYVEEDTYVYPVKVVKELLEAAFDYEDWQSSSNTDDGQPRAKGQVNESGNFTAMLIDVKIAVDKLQEKQRDLILMHHAAHLDFEFIGEVLEITEKNARDRYDRAVKALVKKLGTKPFSDLRNRLETRSKPGTTAEALAITERDYEG